MLKNTQLVRCAIAAITTVLSVTAFAQSYPVKSVRILVGFAPITVVSDVPTVGETVPGYTITSHGIYQPRRTSQ